MASPHKRGRDDRFGFMRAIAGSENVKVDNAIKACERLTDQQLEVIKQIRPPLEVAADSHITLILAAAASG